MQIRKFQYTLKMLAFDCRINRKSREVRRRANFLVKRFKIIFSLLLLAEMIAQFNSVVTMVLYYGPCLYHYLYGTPVFTQIINNEFQVGILEDLLIFLKERL